MSTEHTEVILFAVGVLIRVADRYRFDADPDPTFYFDADPDPDPDPALNLDQVND
jgi:hypothetical protein